MCKREAKIFNILYSRNKYKRNSREIIRELAFLYLDVMNLSSKSEWKYISFFKSTIYYTGHGSRL